jgi:hypothetical protein
MRIVQITPGSGDNFYCENCLRDVALVRAMRQGDRPKAGSIKPAFGGLKLWLPR